MSRKPWYISKMSKYLIFKSESMLCELMLLPAVEKHRV